MRSNQSDFQLHVFAVKAKAMSALSGFFQVEKPKKKTLLEFWTIFSLKAWTILNHNLNENSGASGAQTHIEESRSGGYAQCRQRKLRFDPEFDTGPSESYSYRFDKLFDN